ncbi:pimeloyl-ACP methyl ester carboxylesterase [Streptomyces umbrinus]|uniref:alpha/beta fold hydrolase n=1 Tax=Streptomyces umbrinus TaxID=67370 RepID=UPI00167DB903|nr:alpha/beta hydrolase [Streptomyces umbrinus]MCR3726020.1 pimeloyl-ACP methyl ester carboxylesterase [Streptomyces umbrinus]GHH50117.1 alpha/beta hydrolase [Streptomyces umbrinus]
MSRPATFVPPSGARAYRLVTARGEFAVIEAGSPEKGTALLLPGFTGSKEDFISLHEPLAAAGYRTVAVDGRGQYESPGPTDDETPYAQAELAQDVLSQIDALTASPQERVHLVGHSFGGQVARAAVLLDPSRFRSLTLMASGPAEISPSQQQRVKLLRDALAVMDMGEVWEAIQALEPPEDAEGDLDAGLDDQDDLKRRWLGNSPAQLIAAGRQLCEEPDRVAELAAVGLPVHVLSGERDDTWPVPLLDDMAVRLDAHRTIVHGAEHSPNSDRPRETAEALAAFWDRKQQTGW